MAEAQQSVRATSQSSSWERAALEAPTLRVLSHLPLANCWYRVGLELEMSPYDLDVIEGNYPRDSEMCKLKMFGKWLRGDPDSTYAKLVKALTAVGKRSIAEAMCHAREIPPSILPSTPIQKGIPQPLPAAPEPPACIARYAQYLSGKYDRMSVLPEGDWPPSIGRKYTRLAMIEIERDSLPGAEFAETMERDYIHGKIDKIVGRKQEIGLAEVFLKPGEDELKILMDGAPGVGKTTLSRKICKDWASGEFLQQYHLVVLLQLRDVCINQAKTIEDLFCADDPSLKERVVRHIQETSGENVLLILDGYDELGYEERVRHSFFLDIIKGEKLNKSSVLVTSRPYASDYLQQLECINRHVEVLGFTEEQIRECILQSIPDKAKATELVRLLQERMDITSLCYIPLNCAIMLYVYKQEYSLPATLTKLFEIFILNALKRRPEHLSVDEQRHLIRSKHLENLPRSIKESLNTLGKLAFDCMVQDKLVLEYEELKKVFPECGDIETNLLSLMTAVKSFSQTGPEANYQFLHLTIQEFLAASWVAINMPTNEQATFLKGHLKDDRFRMMLLFLAGLSGLKYSSAASIFKGKIDLRLGPKGYGGRCQFSLYLAHLIFESQNFTLYKSLAAAVEEQVLCLRWYRLTPFDSLVLGHFLHWSGCRWKSLDLSYCTLTGQSLEIFHQISSGQEGSQTQIEQLDFSYNGLTQTSLIPKISWFEHTKEITIKDIKYPDIVQLYTDLLSMKSLISLSLSIKYNPESGVKDMDSETALGCAIERMLRVNRTLKVLDLSDCRLDDAVARHIAAGLSKNASLRKLILYRNNVSSSGAVRIFTSLQHNTSLEELNLSGNRHLTEGDSEAVGCAIERMLIVNRTLKVLKLSHCGIDDAVVKHIAVGLAHNTSELNIGFIELTPDACVHLVMPLHQNSSSSLKKLDISENKLGMEGSVALAEMLSYNKTLTELNITGCGRCSTGSPWYSKTFTEAEIRVIARELLRNTTLKTLKVGYVDKRRLEGEIKRLQAIGHYTSPRWNLNIVVVQ